MDDPRILVIRPGALGDTVVTEPVVAALRSAYPRARIDLAGRTDYLPLLLGPHLADACISGDSSGLTSLFSSGPLKLPPCDVVLAFLPDPDGALLARLHTCCDTAVVFDPRPGEGAAVHIVDHLLASLGPLGVTAVRNQPRLVCVDDWCDAARLLRPRGDYAAIHPGSGGRAKLWRPRGWGEVVAALDTLDVLMTAGPADERTVADVLAQAGATSRLSVVRDQPVTTVAGLVAGAKVFLGCDSGVAHLAAALGVPTVALFGPTDPRVWAPRGPAVRILAGPGSSTGAILPSDVLAAARSICPVIA